MTKPCILMIGNYLPATRWNKNIWHFLSERLENLGWEVITTSSKVHQLPRLLDMIMTVWNQRKRYNLSQIDVFSGKAFIYAEVCSWLLSRLNKPIILTLHGGGLPEFASRYPNRVKRVLQKVDVVITPSPFLQKGLSEFRSDIRLIPNPIDLSASIFRLRKKVSPNLIWVRAFHQVYNPTLAPRVIKELASDFPNIHLSMLGPDKGDGSLAKMMALAKALDVKDKIEVIGGVEHTEIPKWLDKAEIFINTSNYDTSPRSLLEAMANGLCVVSTNVGGITNIVKNGESGILVPPGNAQAMANAIRLILTQPGLDSRLSAAARNRAEQNDWSCILPQWDSLFMEVEEIYHQVNVK